MNKMIIRARSLVLLLSLFAASDALLAQTAPYVFTQAAQPVTTTNATLCGMVVPNGAGTLAWFEWGTNSDYGQVTTPVNIGGGTSVVRVTNLLSGLEPQNRYWCRLMASNVMGAVSGLPVLFATGQRVRIWGDSGLGKTDMPELLTNAVAISAGYLHSLVLKPDGTIVAWGEDFYGETTIPEGLSNVVAVDGGFYHNLALKADGTVAAWGRDDYGQTDVPADLSNVVAVAGGLVQSLALKADGMVVEWGNVDIGLAFPPPDLSNVVAVAAGFSHSLALKADGTVAAWGNGRDGQTNVPPGLSNVIALSANAVNGFALKSDGTVVGWGGRYGQPNVPPGLSNVVAFTGRGEHPAALMMDGTVIEWGDRTTVPTGISNVVSVSEGALNTLVLGGAVPGGNAPPEALAQTNFGAVTTDLVITLSGSDPDSDPLVYRLETPPMTGSLFQWTTNGRGAQISGYFDVQDFGGRVIYAVPPTANDSFTFVAFDGVTNSAPAVVTVNSIQAPTILVQSSGVSVGAGYILNFTGNSNATWSVWTSTNLTTWDVLGAAMQTSPGIFQFNDDEATNWPLRFYRVTWP